MKNIIFMFSALLVISCKNISSEDSDLQLINIKGMEGKPEYIHFITENQGYSFNTVENWPEPTTEELNDPNYLPHPSNNAVIYKTIDGGRNWKKIDSIKNRKFIDAGVLLKKSFYVATIDFFSDDFFLVRKKINADMIESQVESVYGFLQDSSRAYYTSKNGFFSVDNELKSRKVSTVKVGNESLLAANSIYTILRNNSGINFLKVYHDGTERILNLGIEPECMVKKNNDNILIAGYNKKSVVLLNYEVSTSKITIQKEFSGYSIVQGMKCNDRLVCGFIGNIKGAFTEYDVFYSLDNGITWKIKKLVEESYIRPSCIIDNNLYIYSGGDRIQKIKFK